MHSFKGATSALPLLPLRPQHARCRSPAHRGACLWPHDGDVRSASRYCYDYYYYDYYYYYYYCCTSPLKERVINFILNLRQIARFLLFIEVLM